uniref:Uncharacterized protein n=1 Tax=Anguilla anguilla TaxID=7936 RepID=A0A0E9QBR6_ANGAN
MQDTECSDQPEAAVRKSSIQNGIQRSTSNGKVAAGDRTAAAKQLVTF